MKLRGRKTRNALAQVVENKNLRECIQEGSVSFLNIPKNRLPQDRRREPSPGFLEGPRRGERSPARRDMVLVVAQGVPWSFRWVATMRRQAILKQCLSLQEVVGS